MDRRDFFKLAGLTGLCVAAPGIRSARAEGIQGPFFVQVQALGGWEPTMLCDPKGALNKTYSDGDILTAGNIPYAPVGAQWNAFFQTNAHRMVVINGVDVQSNNHEAGLRYSTSGRLGVGNPNIGAMVAGHHARHLPMSYLSFGGYEETQGLIAQTRDVDKERLTAIIHPGRIQPNNPASEHYHAPKARTFIEKAREERLNRLHQHMRLPKLDHSVNSLLSSNVSAENLAKLSSLLPTLDAANEKGRVQLAVAAYLAGIGSSANFVTTPALGFDTHANHDVLHGAAMGKLLDLVNFIWQTVDEAGIADQTVMLITSDFGRTPMYNANNGKDHWPITSMIVVSEVPQFQGNVVHGLTDEGHNAIPLDPVTLMPSEAEDAVIIRPDHVHRSLRDLVGITGTEMDQRFALEPKDDLKLFS